MDYLPNECLLQAIGNLGFKDLLNCQRVSRRMRALSMQALRRVRLLHLKVRGIDEEYECYNDPYYKTRECRSLVTYQIYENWKIPIGSDHQQYIDGVYLDYKVHYKLTPKLSRSELEKGLQQLWRSVFMLLSHCDTEYTRLELTVLDIGGVAASQLQLDEATHAPEIFVANLIISTELVQFVKVIRSKSDIWCRDPAKQSDHTKLWMVGSGALTPNHNISTWPVWDLFHEGHLARCFLKSVGIASEPKWTVNKLVSLIQKWQNGTGFRLLSFEGYFYEQGEIEMNDDSLYTETLKMLENTADDRFQYSTDVINFPNPALYPARGLERKCSITIANITNGTELDVAIGYTYRKVPCMVTRSGVRRHVIDRSSVVLRSVILSQVAG